MPSRKLKPACFLLEWLNAYATAFYLYYVFFHMRLEYGFGNRENLLLSASAGFLYIFAAWLGGKAAQKHGYFFALRMGFSLMALALAAGSQLHGVAAQCTVMILYTIGVCFTWPALEALVSEQETRPGLARMIGIYNLMWSSGAAVAYFTGGALLETLGQGSLFWLPAAIHVVQLLVVMWLAPQAPDVIPQVSSGWDYPEEGAISGEHLTWAAGRRFLRMAWLANPFAYVAMNTVIPMLPDVAARLNLSTAIAGMVGSVWMFARMGAFAMLWRWRGWHYRFGWLAGAYLCMVGTFAILLVAPTLAVMVLAELVFGFAVGLIYYSSLFYSMDVGETKGEHGGFHEALIGLGLFVGPAVGSSTMALYPGEPQAGIWAVSALLVIGLGLLTRLNRRPARAASPAISPAAGP